jgi:uracil-DNA glycosylase
VLRKDCDFSASERDRIGRSRPGSASTVARPPAAGVKPAGAYRSLAALQRANRGCRACADAGFPIASAPIFEGSGGQRAILIGQSPGEAEIQEERPWRGRAGRTLRSWFDVDEDAFYATFYCCSVTRCYPGKSPSGRGDRAPTPRELLLCRPWLDNELRLLRPTLIVPVGSLAIASLLGPRRLADCVGARFSLGDATAIPLPHPSGASGWLNLPENRDRRERAIALVQDELAKAPP